LPTFRVILRSRFEAAVGHDSSIAADYPLTLFTLGIDGRKSRCASEARSVRTCGVETLVTVRILVVDDCANARFLLRLAFEAKGAEVIEAGDGQEGLARARAERVDLIFSDVRMPVMDGLAMIRELRNVAEHRQTPIFVLTSDPDMFRAEEGVQAGADAWLVKTTTPEALWELVERALLVEPLPSLTERPCVHGARRDADECVACFVRACPFRLHREPGLPRSARVSDGWGTR